MALWAKMLCKIAVLLFIVSVIVLASPFSACGYEPRPSEIVLPGCNDRVCEIRRNLQIQAEFTFSAPRATNGARANVLAKVAGLWVPLSTNIDVCAHLVSGTCPMTAGGQYTYRSNADIPDTVGVGTKTTIQVRAVDDQRKVIACTQIAVHVVA